jgi:hypothetical protein
MSELQYVPLKIVSVQMHSCHQADATGDSKFTHDLQFLWMVTYVADNDILQVRAPERMMSVIHPGGG